MAKYVVKYVYERWYDVEIEADSVEEADRKFWEADFAKAPVQVGGEIQKNYDIEEVALV